MVLTCIPFFSSLSGHTEVSAQEQGGVRLSTCRSEQLPQEWKGGWFVGGQLHLYRGGSESISSPGSSHCVLTSLCKARDRCSLGPRSLGFSLLPVRAQLSGKSQSNVFSSSSSSVVTKETLSHAFNEIKYIQVIPGT